MDGTREIKVRDGGTAALIEEGGWCVCLCTLSVLCESSKTAQEGLTLATMISLQSPSSDLCPWEKEERRGQASPVRQSGRHGGSTPDLLPPQAALSPLTDQQTLSRCVSLESRYFTLVVTPRRAPPFSASALMQLASASRDCGVTPNALRCMSGGKMDLVL